MAYSTCEASTAADNGHASMLAEMSDSVLAVEAVVGEPVSASSGSGAKLGPFEGRVFVVGPHVVYNTLLMHRPMIFNFHNYQEFDAINRFDGNVTTLATTIKF